MLAFSSLAWEINMSLESTASKLGELSSDVKSEATKLLNANTFSCTEVVVKVLDKSSPDNEHLHKMIRN